MKVAKRLSEIAPFRVMELLARANELEAQGRDVIHLEVGEPDFATPAPILQAAKHALDDGATRYTDARGNIELREAISGHYADRYSAEVSTDRIFVTAGGSGGLLLLSALLVDPGENLLMTDPGYPCNRHFLSSFNGEGLLVPVTAKENYQLTPDLVEEYWTPRSKGALVASPANPTGSVLSNTDTKRLGDKLAELDGVLIADEIYQGLVYENIQTDTALNVAPDAFIINSFSKYFGMTGWRLGWVVVPPEFAKPLEKLAQNLFICPSSVAQAAAMKAFDVTSIEIMESQRREFAERRNYLVPALRALGFDVPAMPAGAFYVYAGLPAGTPDATDFCARLLEEKFVAITPGQDFGFHDVKRKVRISYARKLSDLQEAVERIGSFVG